MFNLLRIHMTEPSSTSFPIYPDPLPNLPIERGPLEKGVGRWVPEQKHKLLWDYLFATQYAWKKWPQRVLIDPFCGPGRVQVEGESGTRDGGAVLAWRRLADLDVPFTTCLVGDLKEARAQACAKRLEAIGAKNVLSFGGPAVQTVPQMIKAVPTGALCFAFVDPYNLALLSFEMLRQLASLKIDLAIHFSTLDLLRNIDMELDPERARFDEVLPGWRDSSVFQGGKRGLPETFFATWLAAVKNFGFTLAEEMPLVTNKNGHGLYRMIFFARHRLPIRLWNDVARNPTGQLF